jgi:hypothetical protein
MEAEGWYVDPFGAHEARWFSDGTPTGLVRDGGRESTDPPPDTPVSGPLEPFEGAPEPDGSDLLRADRAEATPVDVDPGESAWEGFAGTGGGD